MKRDGKEEGFHRFKLVLKGLIDGVPLDKYGVLMMGHKAFFQVLYFIRETHEGQPFSMECQPVHLSHYSIEMDDFFI